MCRILERYQRQTKTPWRSQVQARTPVWGLRQSNLKRAVPTNPITVQETTKRGRDQHWSRKGQDAIHLCRPRQDGSLLRIIVMDLWVRPKAIQVRLRQWCGLSGGKTRARVFGRFQGRYASYVPWSQDRCQNQYIAHRPKDLRAWIGAWKASKRSFHVIDWYSALASCLLLYGGSRGIQLKGAELKQFQAASSSCEASLWRISSRYDNKFRVE